MELQQAQLGQTPMINLGGYIPAGPERKPAWRSALDAFMMGMAGGAGQHVAQAAFTPDVSREMAADPTLQEAGIQVQKKNALQRFFNPTTQEQYDRSLRTGNEKIAQGKAAENDAKRTKIAQQSLEDTRTHQNKITNLEEERLRLADAQNQRENAARGRKEIQDRVTSINSFLDEGKRTDAIVASENAKTQQVQMLNKQLINQYQNSALAPMLTRGDDVNNKLITEAAASLANEGKLAHTYPTFEAFQADVKARATELAKARLGTAGVPPAQAGLITGNNPLLARPFAPAKDQATNTDMLNAVAMGLQ